MIKKWVTVICVVLVVALWGCQKRISYPEYYGTWRSNSKIVLQPNGVYELFFRDSLQVFKDSNSTYKILQRNDTIWLYVTWRKLPQFDGSKIKHTAKYALMIKGDYLTKLSYKELPGITNHIDEYGVWVKEIPNPRNVEYSGKKIIYVFPSDFAGAAWIAFNQKDGIPPEYDSIGNPILKIPENGILQTSLHEDAFATANRYYSIVKDAGNELVPYKSFDKFDKIDSTCCESESLYAFMQGFNQTSREDINENIFYKSILGNVMTIYIGKYRWFEKNFLHPWDSEMD